MSIDPVRGMTLRWTFADGAMAGGGRVGDQLLARVATRRPNGMTTARSTLSRGST